jgi:hypothetical protein
VQVPQSVLLPFTSEVDKQHWQVGTPEFSEYLQTHATGRRRWLSFCDDDESGDLL